MKNVKNYKNRTSILMYGLLIFGLQGISNPDLALAQIADSDNDGVHDFLDNCVYQANNSQLDTDQDGYGNACDPDYDNSGTVTSADFAQFFTHYGKQNINIDLTGEGSVSTLDFSIFLKHFGKAPGPSALAQMTANKYSNLQVGQKLNLRFLNRNYINFYYHHKIKSIEDDHVKLEHLYNTTENTTDAEFKMLENGIYELRWQDGSCQKGSTSYKHDLVLVVDTNQTGFNASLTRSSPCGNYIEIHSVLISNY